MATGWEHPDTEEFLRSVLPHHIGPIEWLTPERQMIDLIRWKGMFPSRTVRFCTQFLKIFVIKKWVQETYPGVQIINAVGERADESKARAKKKEMDTGWATTWRPLLRWRREDVEAIHRRHNCPPNPLYGLGASRVGCWPCIFARKVEIRLVADIDPDRIALIRHLEEEVVEAARGRYAARGESFESLGYAIPSFFSLRKYTVVNGRRVYKSVGCPIDDVVEWSRTARGQWDNRMFREDGD